MTNFVVAASIADIRHDPDPNSELVTQALMNVSAISNEVVGDWTHVTLSDYSGWIRTDELEDAIVRGFCEGGVGTCGVPLPYSLVVTTPHIPVYVNETGEETLFDVYLSTILPYIDLDHPKRLHIALPGEQEGWIPREAVDIRKNSEPYPVQDIAVVTSCAKAFLGVPYLWGGTSYRGIDCSGLVQLCYRMGGNILPRDADQQYEALPQSIAREEMQAGDLIFFGRERITHVALALNHHEYIHAEGQEYNRVIINSFDLQHPDYNARLDSLVWGLKRVR
jgi:gamma-D-glutamyl-L-lysine dipeptidyl-peptidase